MDPKLAEEAPAIAEENCYGEEHMVLPIETKLGVRVEDRGNFQALSEDRFLSFGGYSFTVFDLKANRQQVFYSQDGGGIGAVAIHPSRNYFAVAEKGCKPNIYVYRISDLTIAATLAGGTERGYCSVSFSKSSAKFLSIGTHPDFSIVVWDWTTAKPLLKAKAFSQEVYKAAFSDFSDNVICSAGMAHIKFWKISNTFTGLKLKGEIGKFGATELSDINDFVHLSDGNVVSGSESGELLLWEGNFIKSVIRQSAEQPCHRGNISCLRLFRESMIFSASEVDNVIRVWSAFDFRSLGNEGNLCNYFRPTKEIALPVGCGIVGLDTSLLHTGVIFAQEKKGALFRIQVCQASNEIDPLGLVQFSPVITKMLTFPSDTICGMELHQKKLYFAGRDGFFKAMDCETKDVEFWEVDPGAVTAMTLVPAKSLAVVGTSTGMVKSYDLKDLGVRNVQKAFEDAVQALRVTGTALLAASRRQIFLFSIDSKGEVKPHFMLENGDSDITSNFLVAGHFFFGTAAGDVRAFRVPPDGFHNSKDNFLVGQLPVEFECKLRMTESQKPKQDEDDIRYYLNDEMVFQDVEWEPTPIRGLAYYGAETSLAKGTSTPKVVVSAEGNFVGYLYVLEMLPRVRPVVEQAKGGPGEESFLVAKRPTHEEDKSQPAKKTDIIRPLKAFKTRPKLVTFIGFENEKDVCFLGYVDGLISIRNPRDFDVETARFRVFGHDFGEIMSVQSFGTQNVFALAKDSTMAVLGSVPTLKQAVEKRPPQKPIEGKLRANECRGVRWTPAEKELAAGYSLQKDKIQSQKDSLARSAKQQREEIFMRIGELRRNFQFLKEQNRRLPIELRIKETELDFDPLYSCQLPDQFEKEVEEVEKELEYDLKVAKMKVDKLNNFFIKENTEFVFGVSKLRSSETVESFRLKQMTNFMTTCMQQISMMIDNDRSADTEQEVRPDELLALSETKALLGTLSELKKRIVETKARDPYVQLKQRIKEDCAGFDTIERLREHQKIVEAEVEALKQSDLGRRRVEDSAEVREARDKFGDFVLKTSKNFKISEKTRIDLQKLETHIVLLEKFVFNTKESFNSNLSVLRSRKQQILRQIEDANQLIADMGSKNGTVSEPLTFHFRNHVEFPELQFAITPAEIAESFPEKTRESASSALQNSPNDLGFEIEQLRHATLAKFPGISVKINRQKAILAKAGYKDRCETPVPLTTSTEPSQPDTRRFYFEEVSKNQQSEISAAAKTAQAELGRLGWDSRKTRKTNTDNSRSQAMRTLEAIQINSQRTQLLRRLNQEIDAFDKEIDKMAVEKRKVDFELKMAQVRVLEVFREWLEIQVFEEEDQIMRKELGEKNAQVKEWTEKKLTNVIAEKEMIVKTEKLGTELRGLEDSYREKIFPSEPEKADFVYKYFSVNYRKNQNGGTLDDGDEAAKEMDPNTLDPEKKECVLFFEQNEEWVELLKKRYETDETLKGVLKSKQAMDADNGRIDERLRILQKSLMDTKAELDDLQFKKLGRVNKLNCSFILDLDQVFLETPLEGIDDSVVFTTEQLRTLKNRIVELEEECQKIESERSELFVSQDALVKYLNILRTCRKQARDELEENFKLKFGQYVNLDILNSLQETKRLKELRKEYREVDKASNKRMEGARNSLTKTQEELVELKRKNTEILKRITWLGTAQIKLNKTLDNTNKQIFKDEKDLQDDSARTNKKDLIGIIRLLNSELDALKGEIAVLKTK